MILRCNCSFFCKKHLTPGVFSLTHFFLFSPHNCLTIHPTGPAQKSSNLASKASFAIPSKPENDPFLFCKPRLENPGMFFITQFWCCSLIFLQLFLAI